MTLNLKQKWFEAVVRQDISYFDFTEVSKTSTIISTNGAKFKKGLAEKLGRGVQSTGTVLAAFGIAFYSDWKVSLAGTSMGRICSPYTTCLTYAFLQLSQPCQ